MNTTEPITPTASGPPTLGDQLAEVLPLVDTVYVAGPPLLVVWAGTVLFALMLAGPFALVATFVMVLVAAAAVVTLAGAILATPFLHPPPPCARRDATPLLGRPGTDRHGRGSGGITMNPSLAGADSRSVVGRFMDHALVERDSEAVDQFVARVLRRAHQSAEARNAADEARAILGVAHLFADELTAGHPGFDGLGFVAAATEGPS